MRNNPLMTRRQDRCWPEQVCVEVLWYGTARQSVLASEPPPSLPVYCVLVLAGSELRRVSSSSAATPGSSSRDVNTTGTMLLWKVIIHTA